MKVIFSRKGFDSAAGGVPSPVIDGIPVSLPIPASGRSETTYGDLGLGDAVLAATRGRISPSHLCHEDPQFAGGCCAFGQTGAAQSHLANQNAGAGDVFLFFGLFRDPEARERHHRIFGYLVVEDILKPGPRPTPQALIGSARNHPHTLGEWNANNTIYTGPGQTALNASDRLRLTMPGGPLSLWNIPPSLAASGMTYHKRPGQWAQQGQLMASARWQEGVSVITDNPAMREWVRETVEAIASFDPKA
jgi:hypothetical protein